MSVTFWQVFLFNHDYFSLLQNIYQVGWTQSDFLWLCFYFHIRKQFKYHKENLGKMILISDNRYAMTSYSPPFCLFNNVLGFCIVFVAYCLYFYPFSFGIILSVLSWIYISLPITRCDIFKLLPLQAMKNSTDISIVRTTPLLTRRSSWTTIWRQSF